MSDLDQLTERTLGGLKIQSVSEQGTNLNLFIYGESGSGKTKLSGSAALVPEMSPVIFLDIEGGTFTIRDQAGIDVFRAKSWDDIQKFYDTLYDNPEMYRTVVIDSLTELQKFSMVEIMKKVIAKDPSRDPEVPSIREWGISLEQTRRMVTAFRDMEINAIFTALVTQERDTRTGLTMNKPQLPGKLSGEVAGFIDEVLYLYVVRQVKGDEVSTKRMLLTDKTDTTMAKDRSGNLPTVVEEPTMPLLYTLMHEGVQE